MTRVAKTLFTLALILTVAACESRTERTDGGGVILSITDFNGYPLVVSVNGTDIVQIDNLTVTNTAKIPGGDTSALMNVEFESYEVTYTRADAGTRIPVPYVRGWFGQVPVNGTATLLNAPIIGFDQFLNPPLSDLLFQNGAVDTETGQARIALNFRLRFFGRTLSGDEVQTQAALFTIDFIP